MLFDLTNGAALDLIEQGTFGPGQHEAIDDLLHAEAEAGRLQKVACGYFRNPLRALADEQEAEQRPRYDAAREPFDGIIEQLGSLAKRLAEADPSRTIAQHMRQLGDNVRQRLHAWGEDDLTEDDILF